METFSWMYPQLHSWWGWICVSISVCQLPVIEGEGDLLCQRVRAVLRKMTYVHSTSVPAASLLMKRCCVERWTEGWQSRAHIHYISGCGADRANEGRERVWRGAELCKLCDRRGFWTVNTVRIQNMKRVVKASELPFSVPTDAPNVLDLKGLVPTHSDTVENVGSIMFKAVHVHTIIKSVI